MGLLLVNASRFSRVNTLPAEKYSAKLEPDSGPIKLERSRTERQRHSNTLASEAAQIFDNKIPIQNSNSCQQFPGGAHLVSHAGAVITVRWGDCVKRIGIDGSPEAIKEVIKSAFGLRTARSFWLEDDSGILTSIDRDMSLGSYTIHLDEGKFMFCILKEVRYIVKVISDPCVSGLTIKICLDNAADELPVQAEEITLCSEDDFYDFLR
ncbi:hypothetical protein Cgig2_010212 [Carnegiea gigantea]|uniref:GT-1/4-like C-terminal domain-containing protein n=1 Tax=Carnegiea gigantea TaxID=171969 RepID=A0A9Q1JU96_9CARY|nr:hypothetical protein Cgig2_010212 [Carnegiea gigantea]